MTTTIMRPRPVDRAIARAITALHVEDRTTPHGEGAPKGLIVRGTCELDPALVGPPGRLHGGLHAVVRTLPILERITAHDPSRTMPCCLDVKIKSPLPLETPIPFEGLYRTSAAGYELTVRHQGTERLDASARSADPREAPDAEALARWRASYEEAVAVPSRERMTVMGVPYELAPDLAFFEVERPDETLAESHLAGCLTERGGFGPAAIAAQLDAIGAIARGTLMRHPQFTTHIRLFLWAGELPAEAPLLFLAQRAGIREERTDHARPVEVRGRTYGTSHVPVLLTDPAFRAVYAHGEVSVHPVDPARFGGFEAMRRLRD